MTASPASVTIDDVREAARRLDGVANRTPVITSRSLNERLGLELFIKAESFQRTGAFKFRGAFNTISQLPAGEDGLAVVTSSAGNHAQAVALSVRLMGGRAVIFMPTETPGIKRRATESYGAKVIEFDRYRDDRDLLVQQYAEREGMAVVHAYDDARIIAGAGTVALELIEDVGPLDTIVVPVGGGGLLSGCAVVAAAMSPSTDVVGVEPDTNPATTRSLEAGQRTVGRVGHTIADGQQLPAPGILNFAIINALVTRVVTVTEQEIASAVIELFTRAKLVVEPSGATAFAAVASRRTQLSARRIGVIISGGNLDPAGFSALLAMSGLAT